MAEVPLLGQGNHTPPTVEEAEEVKHVRTAFLVYFDDEGGIMLETNIDTPIVPERVPTPDEIVAAAAVITKDIQIQELAMTLPPNIAAYNQHVMKQMQEAQLQQQIRENLGK